MKTQVSLRWAILILAGLISSFASAATADSISSPDAFAFDLYARLKEKPGNLFFSPFSISSALEMAAVGARGTTSTEMEAVLKILPEQSKASRAALTDICAKGQVELASANALWTQSGEPLLPDYLERLQTEFSAEPHLVDYIAAPDPARIAINDWVAVQTHDRIRDVLMPGSVTPLTRLILVNAIYFKAPWLSPFQEKQTRTNEFHLLSGETMSVPFMHRTLKATYGEIDSTQLLRLPYKGNDVSMLILLPPTGQLDGLETSLTPEFLSNATAEMGRREVNLYLPKFKLEWGAENLIPALRALGMVEAFGSSADFSGIRGKRDFLIDQVLHKAFVDVTEEGTEAAAATVLGMRTLSMPGRAEPPVVFRADRPFLFLICEHRTGRILFMGRLVQPAG